VHSNAYNPMKKQCLLFATLLLVSLFTFAQQWGNFTLYSVSGSTTAYLVDTNGVNHHIWTGLSGGTGYSSYLMPGGVLWRTVRNTGNQISGGGVTGRVQKVAYDGTLLWDFVYSSSTYCLHHDICPLPNGNVLLISYDVKTSAEATAAGVAVGHTMWSEKIIEVQPTGATTGNIVWEWRFWDHLTQNIDSTKANYHPTVVDHPELMNVNFQNSSTTRDWIHMNGIDYNQALDQIVVSSHNLDELYVIDHSTTTAEAAGHTGGNSGKGGDFLYRWGNPSSYAAAGVRIFDVVHDAHFIPQDCPNAGYIVGYNNNGISANQSCVDMANPPYNGYNYLINPGSAYAPITYTERIPCNGHNSNMGNSQQLPNGNSLICIAQSGIIYEVDSSNTILWTKNAGGSVAQAFRYSPCFVSGTPPVVPTIIASADTLYTDLATSYQWYENGTPITGATGAFFVPDHDGYYAVVVLDANGCPSDVSAPYSYTNTTDIGQIWTNRDLVVSPNPTRGPLRLTGGAVDNKQFTVTVYSADGRQIFRNVNTSQIDLSGVTPGVYTLSFSGHHTSLTQRLVIVAE
jgi:hypothetical protein